MWSEDARTDAAITPIDHDAERDTRKRTEVWAGYVCRIEMEKKEQLLLSL